MPTARGQSESPPPQGYDRLTLTLDAEWAGMYASDLDGDGLMDLVVVEADHSTRNVRQWVRVFRQTSSGFLPFGQVRELPAGVALAGVGRFTSGDASVPGLALLTAEGVSVWPWSAQGFLPAPGMTLVTPSVFAGRTHGLQKGVTWLVDLDGDGRHEMIIPKLDGLLVVRQGEGGGLHAHRLLRVPLFTQVLQWFRRQMAALELPEIRALQINGRGWLDLVTYGEGELNVFLLHAETALSPQLPDLRMDFQPPGPFDPLEPRDPPLMLVDAADLNQDGRLDLVFSKNDAQDSQFNTKTRVLIHFGQPGPPGVPLSFSTTPDHAYATQGFTLPLLSDVNQDHRVDLVMVNAQVGFWSVVRALTARSVYASAALYPMSAEGRYPEQARDTGGYVVRFSLGRYSHRPFSAFGDFNGDGLPDLLLTRGKEELEVRWGRRDALWASDPDLVLQEPLPTQGTRLNVLDLNSDGRDDLILTYDREDIRELPKMNKRLRVLLSRGNPLQPTGRATALKAPRPPEVRP